MGKGQVWDGYGMGMGWVWDGYGTGMGRLRDGTGSSTISYLDLSIKTENSIQFDPEKKDGVAGWSNLP